MIERGWQPQLKGSTPPPRPSCCRCRAPWPSLHPGFIGVRHCLSHCTWCHVIVPFAQASEVFARPPFLLLKAPCRAPADSSGQARSNCHTAMLKALAAHAAVPLPAVTYQRHPAGERLHPPPELADGVRAPVASDNRAKLLLRHCRQLARYVNLSHTAHSTGYAAACCRAACNCSASAALPACRSPQSGRGWLNAGSRPRWAAEAQPAAACAAPAAAGHAR